MISRTLEQWRADLRRLERGGYPVPFDHTRAAILRACIRTYEIEQSREREWWEVDNHV
jgi:hypothetical protein